jgi:hypothetical protein
MAIEKVAGGGLIVAAVGVGAAILGPGLLKAARPKLLQALVVGMAAGREARIALEAAWEDFEDLLAEARATADRAQSEPAETASNVKPFAKPAEPEAPLHGA